jgi:hypothetical protein
MKPLVLHYDVERAFQNLFRKKIFCLKFFYDFVLDVESFLFVIFLHVVFPARNIFIASQLKT